MKNGFLTLSAVNLLLSCSMAYAHPTQMLAAQDTPKFSLSLTGLLLAPNANNLNYGVYTTPLPLPAPNWQQKTINPKLSGAFELAAEYDFAGNKDNLKIDWLHLNTKDSASAGSGLNTSVGPVYYYGPAEQFLLNTSASSSVKFEVEDGHFAFGHVLNISPALHLMPFAGLSVTYLKEDLSTTYLGTDPVYGPYTHSVYGKSKFLGAGPRLGFDSSYFITNQFAITAEVAGELLAGNINYSTDFTSQTGYVGNTAHNNVPTDTSMANQNLTRAVPELGAKVGVQYTQLFANSSSELTFKAGYMYSVYFNAIHQVLPSTLVPGAWEAGSVAIINQTQQDSNIDLIGPYLSVSWTF